MKKLILTFYDNESHGYIKISKYDLQGLKIDENQFSNFSYYNNENACLYLEEDCDATKLLNLLKNKGYEVIFKNKFVEHDYFDNGVFNRLNNERLNDAY
tara:strand:+ start:79 stop:375 length:297 start_codon:yes stop_codon:yes gene_type:complete